VKLATPVSQSTHLAVPTVAVLISGIVIRPDTQGWRARPRRSG
jgi:hypothetical protein